MWCYWAPSIKMYSRNAGLWLCVFGDITLRKIMFSFNDAQTYWPEHGLVPVGLGGAGHVFSHQAAAHHGVVVVLHTSPAQFDVVERADVPGDPDVGASLQLCIDTVTTMDIVHFQPRQFSQVDVWFYPDSHNDVVHWQLQMFSKVSCIWLFWNTCLN